MTPADPTGWTPAELSTIDTTDELHLASRRADGSLRPFVTMWAVRLDDVVVVRSARQVKPWFERALASGTGRVRIGGMEKDVAFEATDRHGPALDAAYHRKYDRYCARIVGSVVGDDAHARTLRLLPTN